MVFQECLYGMSILGDLLRGDICLQQFLQCYKTLAKEIEQTIQMQKVKHSQKTMQLKLKSAVCFYTRLIWPRNLPVCIECLQSTHQEVHMTNFLCQHTAAHEWHQDILVELQCQLAGFPLQTKDLRPRGEALLG